MSFILTFKVSVLGQVEMIVMLKMLYSCIPPTQNQNNNNIFLETHGCR